MVWADWISPPDTGTSAFPFWQWLCSILPLLGRNIRSQGGVLMSALLCGIRYGLRLLAKSPGFTSVSLLALALGIGTTTVIFSLLYCVLLAPLPYAHADGLVMICSHQLYNVGTIDVRALIAVTVILLASAFLACYAPARRASKI